MAEPVPSPAGQLIASVDRVSDLPAALDALEVGRDRPVLVLVGGAGRMSPEHLSRTAEVLARQVVPVIGRLGAAVVDGGTDSGVMRMMGEARHIAGASFPLIGVAPEGKVSAYPAVTGVTTAKIESRHSHVILVPGDSWGDESPWLAKVAEVVAGTAASATLVINGGAITYQDIAHSLVRGRPVIVLAGTGRTADAIATATDHDGLDQDARRIASSPLTRIISIDDGPALAGALESILGRSPGLVTGGRHGLLADLDGLAHPVGRDPVEHARVQEVPERAHYRSQV
jgi:SLOG in TRPM, prokaryote